MTDVQDWLAARRPSPPDELRGHLVVEGPSGPIVDRLVGAALAQLAEARTRPGRVRESAYPLLAADALITYACEAALEADDPETVLTEMLRVGESI